MSPFPSPNNQINDPLNDIDPSNRVHLLTFFDYIIHPSLSRSLQKELKAARQLGILVGVFTVTWLPYFILFVFVAWCHRCIPEKIYTTFVWLGYLNSALNPLIYPLCNKHFRHAFRKIFYCHHGKIKLPNLDELYELHSIHALHSLRYRR